MEKIQMVLAQTLDAHPIPMAITTLQDGVYKYVNDSYLQELGFSREEILGRNSLELGIWLDPEEARQIGKRLLENQLSVSFEAHMQNRYGKAGTARTFFNIIAIDGVPHVVASVVDLTEGKQAQAAARTSESKFANIFYMNNNAMIISRFADGIIFDINNSAADLIGYRREDLLGRSIKEMGIWGESFRREGIIERLRNGSSLEFETKYIKPSGESGSILAKVSIMEIDGVQYALISGTDISERVKAIEDLRASEDKFAKSFHQSGSMKAIARYEDGTLIDVNESYAATFGFAREEIIGKTVTELGMWADRAEQQAMIDKLSREGSVKDCEYAIKTKSGETGTVVANVNLIDIDGERCVLVSSNNITKLKQYEREIAHWGNLKLIAQMAAGVAHEVRNPLASVKGFLQLFGEDHNYAGDKENIELMIEELDRVNEMITTFLSIANEKPVELRLRNLGAQIRNILPLIASDARKADVNIKAELHSTPEIMLDKGDFRKLLLNLTNNGIQAMKPNGTLIIRTFADENGVNLVVRDEGRGITPEVLEKLGTPFLTTKDYGTGLGLAVCYSIAERHKAQIRVDTSPEGTCFTVTFPKP